MTDEVKTKKAPKAAKADAAAKPTAKAPATKKAEAAPATKPGRQANPETVELLDKLTKMASRKTGASNIEVAQELGVTTLKASALGRRLVDKGVLVMAKGENGRVTYQKAA